jgi:hypothetical protein
MTALGSVFFVFCMTGLLLLVGAPQSEATEGVVSAPTFKYLTDELKSSLDWFASEPMVFQLQVIAAISAAASVISNWRAASALFQDVTACERLLSFQGEGKGLGNSDEFQQPMRALFLTYCFYAAYQVHSHISSAAVPANMDALYLEFIVQAFFLVALGGQMLLIWGKARRNWEDSTKRMKFWKIFNGALEKKKVKLHRVAASTLILPVAAILPKSAQALNLTGYGDFLPVIFKIINSLG